MINKNIKIFKSLIKVASRVTPEIQILNDKMFKQAARTTAGSLREIFNRMTANILLVYNVSFASTNSVLKTPICTAFIANRCYRSRKHFMFKEQL